MTAVPLHVTPAGVSLNRGDTFHGDLATFVDATGDTNKSHFSGRVQWGDGSQGPAAIAANPHGGFDVTLNQRVFAIGPIQVVVTDAGEGSVRVMAGTVADVPLTVFPANVSVVEGQKFQGSLATLYDPTGDDNLVDFSATVYWPDGTRGPATLVHGKGDTFLVTASRTMTAAGQIQIEIHEVGGETSSFVAGTVADAPLTVLDYNSGGAPYWVSTEGQSHTGVVAVFTDPGSNGHANSFTATIDWSDGTVSNGVIARSGNNKFSVTGTHTYFGGLIGIGIPIITVTDIGGASVKASLFVIIRDAPLSGNGYTLHAIEGTPVSGTLVSFTDPGGKQPVANYQVAITWGDGTTSTGTVVANTHGRFDVTAPHVYQHMGSYTVTVGILDNAFSAFESTIRIKSTVIVPKGPFTLQATPVDARHALTATDYYVSGQSDQQIATLADPDNTKGAGEYTVTIHWGDGATSAGWARADSISGTFNIYGTHYYGLDAGTHPITVNVRDGDGRTAAVMSLVYAFDDFQLVPNELAAQLGILEADLNSQVFSRPLPIIGTALNSGFLDGLRNSLTTWSPNHDPNPSDFALLVDDRLSAFGASVSVTPNADGSADFEMQVPLQQSATTTVSTFTTGLPGLPLTLDGAAGPAAGSQELVNYYYNLDLHFRVTAPVAIPVLGLGANWPTYQRTVVIESSTLNLPFKSFDLPLDMVGHLGNMLAEATSNGPVQINGTYTVTFVGHGVGLQLSTALNGSSDVNLLVSARTTHDPGAPFSLQFQTGLSYHWTFTNADPTAAGPLGDPLAVTFQDVRFDLGQFISSFMTPIIQEIQKVTKPLETLDDLLTSPIPLLDKIKSISVMDILESNSNGPLHLLTNIVKVINRWNPAQLSAEGDHTVHLGDFQLTDPRANADGSFTPANVSSANPPNQAIIDQAVTILDRFTDARVGAAFKQFIAVTQAVGMHFTMLEDGSQVVEALLDQTSDLFTFTPPQFNASLAYGSYDIPLPNPFLVIHLSYSFPIQAGVTFGYDSSGLLTGDPAHGFYVENADFSIGMSLGIGAGVSVLVGSATINGEITGKVGFDLLSRGRDRNDSPDPHRVYGEQLLDGDFTIQPYGELDGRLYAHAALLGFSTDINFVQGRIIRFKL
jgi:hypothetical protein